MLKTRATRVSGLLSEPFQSNWAVEKQRYRIFNDTAAVALSDGSRRLLIGVDSPEQLIVAGHRGGAFEIGATAYLPVVNATAERIAAEALHTLLPDLDRYEASTEDADQRAWRRARAEQRIAMAVPDDAIEAFTWRKERSACWPHARGQTATATVSEPGDSVTITARLSLAAVERVLAGPLLYEPRRPWRQITWIYSPVGRRLAAAYRSLRPLRNDVRPGTDIYDTTELGCTLGEHFSVHLRLPAPQRATPTALLDLSVTSGVNLAVALIPNLSH
ncbi:hypothetical protein [Kitasatospora aureofaciens]|uniref:hypothetical protein n=1 Tax=Kitasatospora aureofaciens TaxID=1894 RepID=UPI0005266B3E|nr:hypothetical protein [Kitasatospora aureofaciens]